MPTKIICAIDFSDESSRASDAAALLAAKTGETLILLHVSGSSGAGDDSLTSALHVAAGHRLRSEANRLRETGIEVEEVILDGSPSSTLLRYLDESPGQLLIVASQERRSAPARWFSGGLIERIAKNSTIPTLVIRNPRVIEDWLTGNRPLRITIATGPLTSSDVPLLWLKNLALLGPCEITAVHLHWVPEETLRLGLPTSSIFGSTRQLQLLLEKEIQKKTSEILGDLPVKIRVEPRWGRADLPINALAQTENADLIIAGISIGKGIVRFAEESISIDLLHSSSLNLALIPQLEDITKRTVPSYQNLLVPTDFSDAGNLALLHAVAIASPGAIIHLLHVRDRFGISTPAGTDQLKALIPQESLERGIRFETIVEEGDKPSEIILQVAARRMADIICMGSTGRNPISKLIIGSVASQVAATSPRPVLLIPRPV